MGDCFKPVKVDDKRDVCQKHDIYLVTDNYAALSWMECLVPVLKVAQLALTSTLAPYKGETFGRALFTGALIVVFHYALNHLEMLIFRKAHISSLSRPPSPSLFVRACMCVCRLPAALVLLGARRRAETLLRRVSAAGPPPSLPCLPRVVFAVQAPLHSISFPFPPRFGCSHAAVVALEPGQFVIHPAASPWIWRLLGTRTLSPRRYPPPKLNSRFPVGE